MASTLIKAAKDKTKRAHNPTNFCTSQDFLHDKLISFINHFRHLASPSNVTLTGIQMESGQISTQQHSFATCCVGYVDGGHVFTQIFYGILHPH